jgi:hypothetical protein
MKFQNIIHGIIQDNSAKQFNIRKQGIPVSGHLNIFKADTMGRMYTIHPSNPECFFLRIVLHNLRGPTSYEDIRNIGGIIDETYREACKRLGLLKDDKH